MDEFSFIKEYLSPIANSSADVPVSIGDDCAIISPTPYHELCISTDAQIEGRHFPVDAPWDLVVLRAVGCAVSDLAAMGAKPIGMTAALAIPNIEPALAQRIQRGFLWAQDRYSCPLIGGDTTFGPRMVSITVTGETPSDERLLRSNAHPGEDVWVTGTLGNASHALADLSVHDINAMDEFQKAYWMPPCYIDFAQSIRSIATSALDISDGLAGDIRHIISSSKVGVDLVSEYLPISKSLLKELPEQQAFELALSGGDDYQILLTAKPEDRERLLLIAKAQGVSLTLIGSTNTSRKLCLLRDGMRKEIAMTGYSHF